MLLDFESEAPIGALQSKPVLKLAAKIGEKGILPASSLATVFAWMRPERSRVELLGEQLSRGQGSAEFRHPRLERRRHQFAGPCMDSSSTSSRTIRCPSGKR
jgi:poly(3-hydroxyalkanoate) synthetase